MTRSIHAYLTILALGALASAPVGCSSSDDGVAGGGQGGSGGGQTCTPNMQSSCLCPDGSQGVYACFSDGSGWGPCTGCGSGTGGTGAGGSTGGSGGSGSGITCQQFQQQNSWHNSICQTAGNNACNNAGTPTSDCDFCCPGPSCNDVAMQQGYAQRGCDDGVNGVCAGRGGPATWDCATCCDLGNSGSGGTGGSGTGGSGTGGSGTGGTGTGGTGGGATTCASATLGVNVVANTCVQSKNDCLWYKCNPPDWYLQGGGTTPGTGCSSTHSYSGCSSGTGGSGGSGGCGSTCSASRCCGPLCCPNVFPYCADKVTGVCCDVPGGNCIN